MRKHLTILASLMLVTWLPATPAAAAPEQVHAFRTIVDPDGTTHVRYTRTYHGLRVLGGDFVTHSNGKRSDGLQRPLNVDVRPAIRSGRAADLARQLFGGTIVSVADPELVVYAPEGGRLVWDTVVSGWAGQIPSILHIYLDAHTGVHLGSHDEVESLIPAAQAKTLYAGNVAIDTSGSVGNFSMIDPVRGNGTTCDMNNAVGACTTFTDADNVWGNNSNSSRQSAGADAHYGAAVTFDYYKYVHGRNGIFGNGTGVPSRVHYGNAVRNAYWLNNTMTYGDNTGNARPLVSLDVAGHEMTHGVTANVVPGGLGNLATYNEANGLNESTSDIFGTMVEFYAQNAVDAGDYLIGEKINFNGDGKPLRYMYNPSLDGHSHTCWSTSTAGVDEHYSSGVGNHFFFMLAEGSGTTSYGVSPVCAGAPAVAGIGRSQAQKIWFRALDVYFTSTTSYVNASNPGNTARAYTLAAATDLYGYCGTEYKAVQAAWRAVNVSGSDSVCPTPLSVYITGPGSITVKGTYTYTAIHSGFSANPTFTWFDRDCADYAGSSCTGWIQTTGLGDTFNRTLSIDCSGAGEANFQLRVEMLNADGRTASASMTTYLCGPA